MIVTISGWSVCIDDADASLIKDGGWFVKLNNGLPYACRNTHVGRQVVSFDALHRVLMGSPAGAMVDHVSGDTLDNRRSNLRICSHTQNMQNRKIHSDNKSGRKGIYLDSSGATNKWRAQIRVDGKKICIGRFLTAEEAEAAYAAASVKYHGEYSRATAM